MTPTQEYLGSMALVLIGGGIMVFNRWRAKHPMSAEDMITLTGHFSGLAIAVYIVMAGYNTATTPSGMGVGTGVAVTVGGLIWGVVSLIGAYRLIWTAVPPKEASPSSD